MRIIVAGGRFDRLSITDQAFILNLVEEGVLTTLVCGMCKGIDLDSYRLLEGRVPIDEYPALWNDLTVDNCLVKTNKQGHQYNALAGYNRNLLMAQNADAVILFQGGSGTDDMYKIAKKEGLEILGDFREILY